MSSVVLNAIKELKSKVNEITGIKEVLEEFKNDYIRQQTADTRHEMIENITQAILTAMSNEDQTAGKKEILCGLEKVLETLNEGNKKILEMSQKLENVEKENSKLIKEVDSMKRRQENFIQSQKKMENEVTKEMQSLHRHLNTFKLSNATKKDDKLLNQLKQQAKETKKLQNSINKLLEKKMSCEACPQLLDLMNIQRVQPLHDTSVGKENLQQSARKKCTIVKRLESCTTSKILGLRNQNEPALQNDNFIETEAIGSRTRSQTAKRKRLEVACCTSAKSSNVCSLPKFTKNANSASKKCHQSSPEVIVISSPEKDDSKSPKNKKIATRKREEKACKFEKNRCGYQDVANSMKSISFPPTVPPFQNVFSRSVATCSHQSQRHTTAESIQMTWSVRKDTYFDSELDDIFG